MPLEMMRILDNENLNEVAIEAESRLQKVIESLQIEGPLSIAKAVDWIGTV